MITWTIPTPATPPTPTSTSTDAQWTNYLAYVREMSDRDRFSANMDAMAAATAANEARAQAEQAVAAAGSAQAAAISKSADVIAAGDAKEPVPAVTVSEATLLELAKLIAPMLAVMNGKAA